MKKLIIGLGAIILVSAAFAGTTVDVTGVNSWGAPIYQTQGLHGSVGVNANELVGANAGPVATMGGNFTMSYALDNGYVFYSKINASRSFDALGFSNKSFGERQGYMSNNFVPTLGVQKNLSGVDLGVEGSYMNYAYNGTTMVELGEPTMHVVGQSVGYGFMPYAQYSSGANHYYVAYNYQNLWDAQEQYANQYTGNGILNKGNVAYSYDVSSNMTVGVSVTCQTVNQPYAWAASAQYINMNNYQAMTGTSDYFEIKPGVTYTIPEITGLTFGAAVGYDGFNYRKNTTPAYGPGYLGAIVFTPAMNYAIGVTDNVNLNLNAQYNVMTRLSSSGSITGNQTLNNSFQCGAGMSYSF